MKGKCKKIFIYLFIYLLELSHKKNIRYFQTGINTIINIFNEILRKQIILDQINLNRLAELKNWNDIKTFNNKKLQVSFPISHTDNDKSKTAESKIIQYSVTVVFIALFCRWDKEIYPNLKFSRELQK